MKLNSQVVGNIGMYYASYRLSQLGWNVMPTARNARGIDLVMYTSDGSSFLGIQVKALSKKNPVPLGTSLEKIMGDYWVFVTKVRHDPVCYILKPGEVREMAHRGEKNGKVSFWLQPKSYSTFAFQEAWDRIQPKPCS
ncbi:hypothetical protein [Desulfohalovibrio reitneri]|uniref:hypothetical protein n=1 Tax=Desulfohalovibrio reitneri TaxID=1307759 RepID=UPI0004A770A5|nr:hypothetical protein [Desulfohalovibrio reitneri]